MERVTQTKTCLDFGRNSKIPRGRPGAPAGKSAFPREAGPTTERWMCVQALAKMDFDWSFDCDLIDKRSEDTENDVFLDILPVFFDRIA